MKAGALLAVIGVAAAPYAVDGFGSLIGPPADNGCRVVSVIDGDTVRIYCPGRGNEKARLLGYDTPETFSPRCLSEYAKGVRAAWALRLKLLSAERVTLVRQGEDRYGRALVFVGLDNAPLARTMIEAGHARAYRGGARPNWCAGGAGREAHLSGGERHV